MSWPKEQGDLFERRYIEWLAARAEQQRLNLPESVLPDPAFKRAHAAASQRLQEVTQLAITTHAPAEWMIWCKFEILEHALAENQDSPFTDGRCIWMLAGIKANLMALGIGSDNAG